MHSYKPTAYLIVLHLGLCGNVCDHSAQTSNTTVLVCLAPLIYKTRLSNTHAFVDAAQFCFRPSYKPCPAPPLCYFLPSPPLPPLLPSTYFTPIVPALCPSKPQKHDLNRVERRAHRQGSISRRCTTTDTVKKCTYCMWDT